MILAPPDAPVAHMLTAEQIFKLLYLGALLWRHCEEG